MLLIKIILILLFLVIVYQNFKINSLEDDINEIEKELVVEESFLDFSTLRHGTKKISIIKILEEELKNKSDELDRQNNLIKHLEKYLKITYVKQESKTEGYKELAFTIPHGSGVTYLDCSGSTDVSFEETKKVAKKSKKK